MRSLHGIGEGDRPWRVLRHGRGSGPWNMGVDEALLASAIREGTASLRFYRWRGPWLSLGYAQRPSPERLRGLAAGGVRWVRRSTGGRAVLHGADLTYAIAVPESRLPPTLRASYGLVADALLAALESLGVPAERSAPRPAASAAPPEGFDCFERAAEDEICIGGLKVSGSAQRRVAGALLQHGSIRIAPDDACARAAVAAGMEGGTSLREAGFDVAPSVLAEACLSALGAVLEVEIEPGELAPGELAHARRRGLEPARGAAKATPGGSSVGADA